MKHHPPLLIAASVAILAIAGLIIVPGTSYSGAITLQDQAGYEIALQAFNRCDPNANPFIESDRAREACCSQSCFSPCLTSGIEDCDTTCKTVCLDKPAYRAGGSR